MTAIILENLLQQKAHQFAQKELTVLSPALKNNVHNLFTESYDSLSYVERYAKALALLSSCQNKVDTIKLEEAAIILDHLSTTTIDIPLYEALTFVHALAGRFSEAHDALSKIQLSSENKENYETLDHILNTKNVQSRKQIKSLHFNPEKSYIINYEPERKEVMKRLLKEDNCEVIAVVDDIKYLPELRKSFEDSLYTIETESAIHDLYIPHQRSKLRIILKNSNSAIAEKGINLGIRKAKQDLSERIFTVNDQGNSSPLSNYINSRPTLAKIITAKRKSTIALFGTTKENTHGVPVVMNNIAEQLATTSSYELNIITNNFDNNEIVFTDSDGKEYTLKNREKFIQFLEEKGIRIDLFHAHSWHMSDFYKPFHAARDDIDLSAFLKRLKMPKLIFTDHSNPTEDLRRLGEHYPSINYSALTEEEKGIFLYEKLLDYVSQWEKGWEATSLLSKRQMMDFADAVVFVSKTQMLEEQENIPHYHFHHKACVVMNGVDIGKYNTPEIEEIIHSLQQDLNINNEEKIVLFAGRMDEEKGIYDLAEAAELLQAKGEKITIIYLGSTDPSDHTKQKLQQISPQVRLLFPPRISRMERQKMAAMYALADIVAQPTWGECFNQTVAEALAMGTPAVVSDFSALGEIYVKNGAALGVKVRDHVDLAAKLSQLLNNKETYEKIKRTGQKLVETSLNVERMGDDYKKLYQTILQH